LTETKDRFANLRLRNMNKNSSLRRFSAESPRRFFRGLLAVSIAFALTVSGEAMASSMKLGNAQISVKLSTTRSGVPRIERIAWEKGRSALVKEARSSDLSAWLPEDLLPEPGAGATWRVVEHPVFTRAEAALPLRDGMIATWVVDLARDEALIRMHVRLANGGTESRAIPWFPVWAADWKMPGRDDRLCWWRSLSFERDERKLDPGFQKDLHSLVHSSDKHQGGVNPYWVTSGEAGHAYFSLDWCGGWHAALQGTKNGLAFRITLPEAETQLTLKGGEEIAGPVLGVVFTREPDEALSRAAWNCQRASFGQTLYGGPAPSYPFTWNHWYSVRFSIDTAFIDQQVAAMDPYELDYFIVDAGWYEACGIWDPDPAKFAPGRFEKAMRAVKDAGVKPGIWTCPQFVRAPADALPPEVDQPGFYRKFIDGHLLDMAGMDFSQFLLDHVAKMRKDYFADWWKYDQDFFTTNATRHGRMKNVVALQEALLAVRKAHPDLYIENCQSGGRMINELTVLMTQGQWICDGGGGGLGHARDNLHKVLGSIEFLPPWTAIRWINRPDENDQSDDEFTKMYCRSAMAGVWGVVADLPKIGEHQQNVIVKEIANYRRLNTLKKDNLFDLYLDGVGAPAAGVVFFTADGAQAGILLLRWDAKGAFSFPVDLSKLDPARQYRVETADQVGTATSSGHDLTNNGLSVAFTEEQKSALIFISAGKP
jgi:alpha-galactosidase